MEIELRNLLAELLEKLKEQGQIEKLYDGHTAATVIYNVHNARFIEFASNHDISRADINRRCKKDLEFIVDRLVR